MEKTEPNRDRYLRSLSQELLSQANRVRDLIGDRHWLCDGHHKEELLLGLIRRHLPAGMLASRGFVVSPAVPDRVSKEQDILIVDGTSEAPVFSNGDFVIVFPSLVRAAISVKTTMSKAMIVDATVGLGTVRRVALNAVDPRLIWCGAFFFVEDKQVRRNASLGYRYIREALSASTPDAPIITPQLTPPQGPDLYATSGDLVFRVDYSGHEGEAESRIVGTRCDGLSTALFLANLLGHVSMCREGRSGFSDLANVSDLAVIPDSSP